VTETTWDTDEVERWIDNDEGIYNTFHSPTGRFHGSAVELRNFFTEFPIEGVDLEEVDWDQIVEDMSVED
jgi:hypothetical protein